jgi:archaellum biogenesis ATPase FlaH
MSSKHKEHKRIVWNTIQPKEITWLWPGRIPFGKLTVFAGDSGQGKTTIAIDLAARLTTGRPMPLSDEPPIVSRVLFQSQEDDMADTLIPRAINAGADSGKFISIDAADLNIDDDCDIIEEYIQADKIRLAIFDPLQSFVGKNADMCRITDIRRLLTNLGKVAARNDCAIIIISHQSKGQQGGNALHRVFGSVDITATARSVLNISALESDPETKIISHIKSSVSRPAPPVAFRIEDNAPVTYLGEYDGDIPFDEMPDDTSKCEAAKLIIISMLREAPQIGKDVYQACLDAGISSRTVERAKKELNILSDRDGSRRLWVLK